MKNNKNDYEVSFIITFFISAAIALAVMISFSIDFPSILKKEDKRECIQWKNWIQGGNWIQGFRPSKEMILGCRQLGVELSATKGKKKEVRI